MKNLLYILNFLCKGWEVSLLILLPFLQKDFNLNLFHVGLLGMIMVLAQILTTISMGNLSTIFGGKRLIIGTILFYGISWLTLLLPFNFSMLAFVYICGGIGSGIFEPLANSFAAQLAHEKKRSEGIAQVEAFGDLGRIGISALTTWLIALLSWKLLAGFYGFLAMSVFFLYIFTIHTNNYDITLVTVSKKRLLSFLNNPHFVRAMFSGIFDSFASSSLYIFIPFLLISKHIDLSSVGFFMTLFFVGYLSGRIFLGRLSDKHGIVMMFILSDIFMAIFTILLILLHSLFIIALLLFFLGVFTRGTSPIVKAMVAEAIGKKENFDKGYSLYSFASRSSSVASRPILGYTANTFGISYAFYLATIVALFATIPAWYIKKQK